jgi:hypothetical protein
MQLPEKLRAGLNRIDRPRIVQDSRTTVGQFLCAVVRYHDTPGGVRRINVAVERGMTIEAVSFSGMSPERKTPEAFLLPQIEDCFV